MKQNEEKKTLSRDLVFWERDKGQPAEPGWLKEEADLASAEALIRPDTADAKTQTLEQMQVQTQEQEVRQAGKKTPARESEAEAREDAGAAQSARERAAEAMTDSEIAKQVAAEQARVDAGHKGEAPLIELRDIYKIYKMGDEEVRASDGVSLKIWRGEFVAIVGKSGSGKSTLMNIIGALDVPTEGEYLLGGEDTSEMTDDELSEIRNKMIGFVFQQYNLLPKLNLLENVELPLLYQGVGKEERRERAMHSLDRVGLAEKWRNVPNQLSGGQQQRVSIARALAGDPSLILADEPTGALDSKTSKEVLGFLKKLNAEGNTIVMITHDPTIAMNSKRVVQVLDGKIIFDGDVNEYAAKL